MPDPVPDYPAQKLEETIAHHDRQIDDLNEVIIQQGKDIDSLKAIVKKLHKKMTAIQDDLDETSPALSVSDQAKRDKPPHY